MCKITWEFFDGEIEEMIVDISFKEAVDYAEDRWFMIKDIHKYRVCEV